MTYTSSALAKTLQGGGGIKFTSKMGILQLLREKGGFMSKTITLFIAQLIVTYAIFHILGNSKTYTDWISTHKIVYFGIMLMPLIVILALAFIPMPTAWKIVLFTVMSVMLGLSLALLKRVVPSEIIRASLVGSMVVFASMFFFGILLTLLGVKLWWLGVILFIALLGLLITSIVFIFIEPSKQAYRIKAVIALVVFALFVMFDTNQILQRNYQGDYVTAAIDYYLDMINLVINFVQYYMSDE